VVTAVLVSACSAAFPGVASLEGSPAEQQSDGAVMLVILLATMFVAGLWTARAARTDEGSRRLRHARRLPMAAALAVALCMVGLVIGGLGERGGERQAGPSRLVSVESSRYEYWKVGLGAFGEDPLTGAGAGGFRVAWRQEREVRVGVLEVHSIFLEMLAELGIPGLVLLLLLLGGVTAGGRNALRAGAAIAPGACAACSAWLLHAAIDWDLQLPAVTLPAVILAGALLASGEESVSASA
jgi:O-antigen ligase